VADVPAPTDEALMERYCNGENQALEALFERHAGPVHGFLTRMVRDRALADDLLQATFLSVVRSADRYQRGAKVLPWLMTIAANAARDSLRRSSQQVELLTDHRDLPEPSVLPAPSDPKARKLIEDAFAQLPAQQREAVVMHKLNGLSFEEIARALNISETAARIRAHRGYEKLRALLETLS
jgi:RNA polymerase sigma factor (sigma-70 family)